MTNKDALNWIQYNLSHSEATKEVSELFRNLQEVAEKFRNFKFKGRGQQKTRILTVDQAIGVLERLPGPNGKRISDHIRRFKLFSISSTAANKDLPSVW